MQLRPPPLNGLKPMPAALLAVATLATLVALAALILQLLKEIVVIVVFGERHALFRTAAQARATLGRGDVHPYPYLHTHTTRKAL